MKNDLDDSPFKAMNQGHLPFFYSFVGAKHFCPCRLNFFALHPAMLRSIPLRYISLYGCRRISLKITKPSVENTSALPDGSVIFILAWLVAYSNSFTREIQTVFSYSFRTSCTYHLMRFSIYSYHSNATVPKMYPFLISQSSLLLL